MLCHASCRELHAGQSRHQPLQLEPRIGLDHALDRAIDALGIEHQVAQRRTGHPAERLLHRGLARPPHVERIHRGLGALPSPHQAARARDPLQILVHCPQHERRLDVFAAQTFENSQRARRLASHRRFAQLQNIEASAVRDRIDDCLRRDRTRRQQQRELLDLLVRRQQIAFDALCEQRRGGGIGLQLVTPEPLTNPRGQPRQIDRPDLHQHAALLDRAHPTRALRAAVELAGDDQHQIVGRRLLRKLDDGIRALLARRRIRHANLDDLALGEQRHRPTVGEQPVPIEAALDDVQLALGETLLARGGANRVRGFVDQQRLVSGHEVDRLELTGQAGSEVVAGKLHLAERDRLSRTRRSGGNRRRNGGTLERVKLCVWRQVDPGERWADYGPSCPARP